MERLELTDVRDVRMSAGTCQLGKYTSGFDEKNWVSPGIT